jgi:hypothetical protein
MNTVFSINIDRKVYADAVISKAAYWYTEKFMIDRIRKDDLEII